MQSFMVTLLTCSITMSALALFYMAAVPLLARRYSEKGLYYTWLVIIIGLIIPFRPQYDNALFKVGIPDEAASSILQTNNETFAATFAAPVMIESILPASAPSGISWWQAAAAVWLAGMIAFLVCHAIRHYHFVKTTERWSENINDAPTLALLQDLKTEMGISHQINLYRCSNIGSPMLIGYVDSRILLPEADFKPNELRFILQHELVHLFRKDLWYKCLVLTATAIHWFNPLVYLTAKAIDIQCELSCDAAVVGKADIDTRRYYSETILKLIKSQSKLKTILSTNFYRGKKGMKKRIFSIMDMKKKKNGFAIICSTLIITLGTGFAFAVNAAAGTPQAIGNTAVHAVENAYDRSVIFERYETYGLAYDKTTDNLYFNGELVRYFEDWYPVGEDGSNAYAGNDYFNENGTIDVHGVRDLSQITRSTDGSYDPSGKLLGVEPYSQADFDARDIEQLKNPPQTAATVNSSDYASTLNYYGGSDFILIVESREAFKKYEEFGLTYDNDNIFRYQGKTVRWFADLDGGMSFTRSVANDFDESVDLTALRDTGGNLTRLSPAGREEFDLRTKRIEQSEREREEFYKNHPNITSSDSVSYETGAAYGTSQSGSGTDTITAYATSYDPNYVDTGLNDYTNYGVTYDKSSKTWMFHDKPVSFLLDSDYQI